MSEIAFVRAVRLGGEDRVFLPRDEPVDIVISGGTIIDIAPTGILQPRGDVLDGGGHWAVPGLWDHHVHGVQWALHAQRVLLGEATSAVHAAQLVGAVPPLPDGRVVGVGFRDALWADAPSLAVLDAATGERETYLINADVHSVWLNSAALRREGFVSSDGVLREEDAFEISRRLNAVDPLVADAAVRSALERAAGRGVVGIVDYEMSWNISAWERRVAAGFDACRVEVSVSARDLDRAVDEGLRSGEWRDGGRGGLVRVGPVKIISDGSLGTRTAACHHAYADDPGNRGVLTVPPDLLREILARSTAAGLATAVHAIGDRAVEAALDAYAQTGAQGTIEHAQLVSSRDLVRFARLGVAASVQPQHERDDRELAGLLWNQQDGIAYPLASLLRAGAEVRFGSDAPVSPLDPWQGIATAVSRENAQSVPQTAGEGITVDDALRASGAARYREGVIAGLRPGARADIVLCGRDPQSCAEPDLRSMPVHATLLGGRITHAG